MPKKPVDTSAPRQTDQPFIGLNRVEFLAAVTKAANEAASAEYVRQLRAGGIVGHIHVEPPPEGLLQTELIELKDFDIDLGGGETTRAVWI